MTSPSVLMYFGGVRCVLLITLTAARAVAAECPPGTSEVLDSDTGLKECLAIEPTPDRTRELRCPTRMMEVLNEDRQVECWPQRQAPAQDSPDSETPDSPQFRFTALERFDAASLFEMRFGLPIHKTMDQFVTGYAELYYQRGFDAGPGHLGFYGDVPAMATVNQYGGLDSYLLDVDLGSYYAVPLTRVLTTFRLGASLPAFGGGDEDNPPVWKGGHAAFLGSFMRPGDVATFVPAPLVRLSGSPTLRAGPTILKADIGLDFPLGGKLDPVSKILRINAGAGIELGGTALSAESTNVVFLGGSGLRPFYSVLTLALRFHRASAKPFFAVGIPVTAVSARTLLCTATFGLSG